MGKVANHTPDRVNTENQTGFPVKCVWLEIVLESELQLSDKRYLDKNKLFDELNQDCWDLFDNMMEWQSNAIRYSLPTD